MALPDLQSLSDEELEAHFQKVTAEQQRRRNLQMIPHQFADLRDRFLQCGGDPEVLKQLSIPDTTP